VIEWHHPYPFVVSPECSQEHSFFAKQFFLLSLRHVLFKFLFKCKSLFVIIWYSFHLCHISKSIFFWWDMENILLLEFVPKSPFMSFCLFALIMTFLTCLVSKEPSSYVKNILMKHFSQNSLVDNVTARFSLDLFII